VIAVNEVAELRRILDEVRDAGGRVALVPTMGYLHAGHLSLCDAARRHADFVVLSVFVNPLQFGGGEDLEQYPRDLGRDAKAAMDHGVNLLFAPSTATMYPQGDTVTRVTAPGISGRLCGRYRPGHFDGVLTVVAKLFNLVSPAVAVFGQKDLQQATLIRSMVRDLDFRLDVHVAPTVREPDGVAMSSRNVYLQPDQRVAASSLYRSLQAAQAAFTAGERAPAALVAAAQAILEGESGVSIQYVELVDPETLEPPMQARRGDALAIAVHVGETRLIDNHLLE
jgi:pantoate--beta-alanine ligase